MPATKRAVKTSYDVHPSLAMFQSSLAGLKQKTGRTLDEWIKFVEKEGPPTEKERRAWLKQKHGLGMNYAWWIAERSVGKGDDGTPETYLKQADEHVAKMYSGAKEALRPIYDELLAFGRSLGKDVKVCPCQTMVPLYRKHVFAQIKPTTRTRIDLGLALKDTKVPKRLIDTGGFAKKDRITHRIEITSLKDIDVEVKKWIKTAYEMDE
ncbi:MAG TPA: DUF5655 domain-containing protein [Candidatus Angelobacter sp.]|nr:DUF5655 domain-containing protein [Candidatus Angelobacter sp.]